MPIITNFQPDQSAEIAAALERAEEGRFYHWTRSSVVQVNDRIYEVALNIFERIYQFFLSLIGSDYLSHFFDGKAVELLDKEAVRVIHERISPLVPSRPPETKLEKLIDETFSHPFYLLDEAARQIKQLFEEQGETQKSYASLRGVPREAVAEVLSTILPPKVDKSLAFLYLIMKEGESDPSGQTIMGASCTKDATFSYDFFDRRVGNHSMEGYDAISGWKAYTIQRTIEATKLIPLESGDREIVQAANKLIAAINKRLFEAFAIRFIKTVTNKESSHIEIALDLPDDHPMEVLSLLEKKGLIQSYSIDLDDPRLHVLVPIKSPPGKSFY